MKKKIILFSSILAAIILLVLAGRYGFTVVKIEDVEQAVLSEIFDPVTYVDSIWDSQIMPTFNEKAVELPTILSQFEVDADGMASKDSLLPIVKEYGLTTAGDAHIYLVKGSGTISQINTDTSLGTIELTVNGYDGPIKVLLYIGTRIPSDETSIRDGVGFIYIGDFKDQMEYGKVCQEINKRILSQVLGNLDIDSLLGKTVTFKGAFNIRTFNLIQINLEEIRIVPVELTIGD